MSLCAKAYSNSSGLVWCRVSVDSKSFGLNYKGMFESFEEGTFSQNVWKQNIGLVGGLRSVGHVRWFMYN